MNKKELEIVIAHKLGIPQNEVHLVVNVMLDSISEVLTTNEEVNLHNFGKLYPYRRKERPVRNPKTGTPCMLEPIRTVKFLPGKGLINYINTK